MRGSLLSITTRRNPHPTLSLAKGQVETPAKSAYALTLATFPC
jgi:hypothetical protein